MLGGKHRHTDSSTYSEEEISDEEVFSRVQRLLRDVKKVPVVPDMFSTVSPPKQVLDKRSRCIVIKYFYLSVILIEFLLFVGGRGAI